VVQSIAGTNLAANWAGASQALCRKVEFQWNGADWVDETAYVLSCTTRVGLSANGVNGLPMLGGGAASSGNITLSNVTGRYSQHLAAGDLYADIQYGFMLIPVRISLGYVDATNGAELITTFTGYIFKPLESESAPGMRAVTFELRGGELPILQYKQSSGLYLGYRIDQTVAAILTAAGVALQSLDHGTIPIPYCWLDDENTWEQCLLLAQAEAAMFWYSETGYATLRRLSSLVERPASTSSQLTLDRGKAWYLDVNQPAMAAYSKAVVEISPRQPGAAEVIYTSPEAIEVPASGSKTVTTKFRSAVSAVITPALNTDYYAVSAGMQDMSGSVSVSATLKCQRGEYTFSNSHASQPLYVYGFQLRGFPLVGEESQTAEAEADSTTLTNYWRGAAAGVKECRPPANPFVQTLQQGQLIADITASWMKIPRPLVMWRGPGAPWLQILDRVSVDDADNSGIDEDCYVIDKTENSTGARYEQTLLLLPCASLFPSSGYFILGTSAYKNTGSGKAFF